MAAEGLILGTRGSELALWQSNHIISKLTALFPTLPLELRVIKTLGDKILDSPLSKIGDKGLFTKEIDRALLERTIDIAVHSLKDVPTQLPEGLTIGAITVREDVHDVFISHPRKRSLGITNLPKGAKIATGSLRRKSQLLHHRPDFQIVDIRGNLNTRMRRLEDSDWDGMILAHAGVQRLGWEERITEVLPFELMLPAVGQGALAIEMREDDTKARQHVQPIHDDATAKVVRGERALLRKLEGGCQIPIGTYGRLEDGQFRLDAFIGSIDGTQTVRAEIAGSPEESESLGASLADRLLSQGGKEILDEIRSHGDADQSSEL